MADFGFAYDIPGGSTADMAVTTAAANAVLNHIFGYAPVLTPPENYYLGLSRTPISPEGIGITEPIGGAYERVVLPNDKNTFSSAANRTIQLTKEFRFPRPTAAWGNITHYFISDAPTGGSIWYCGKLAAPRNVESATSLIVKPDSIKLSLVSSSLAV